VIRNGNEGKRGKLVEREEVRRGEKEAVAIDIKRAAFFFYVGEFTER
jgi:hypothetical protein